MAQFVLPRIEFKIVKSKYHRPQIFFVTHEAAGRSPKNPPKTPKRGFCPADSFAPTAQQEIGMITGKFKQVLWAIPIILALGSTAHSETISVKAGNDISVETAISNIKGAVDAAGAMVFTIVNYQQGAASVGDVIRPTTLIIFGSPKIGGAVFQESQSFGLYLPLRILAHEDAEGQVWLTYDDPAAAAKTHGVPADHPAIINMGKALKMFSGLAVNG